MTHKFTVYHNPRCSKSRAVVAMLEDRGQSFEVIRYLDEPPTIQTLTHLQNLIGCGVRDMMRTGEAVYKERNLGADHLSDEDLRAEIVENPILLTRPIIACGDKKAVIGRPLENVLALFQD